MTRRAILSVSDKTGLVRLAEGLVELGWELVASGGTASQLREASLPVREVSEITGAPEMLGGRVKTLHPAIHAGILARPVALDLAELVRQGITPVDLVVCNLYPFTQALARGDLDEAELIEQIDIGGVTLLRAAAKNYARVAAICDPADYPALLDALRQDRLDLALRRRLAARAFAHTRDYDVAVAAALAGFAGERADEPMPGAMTLPLVRAAALRYGENPHQAAALYASRPEAGPLGGTQLGGKPLSYNNLLDLDAAWSAAIDFGAPAVVVVKHLSPCGIAVGRDLAAAFPPALASDPVSAFGGVLGVNREVDMAFVARLDAARLFVEAIAAPAFAAGAVAWFAAHKPNCRLVSIPAGDEPTLTWRSVRGGVLAQEIDPGDPAETEWRVVTERRPSEAEWRDLRFAWEACRHVKSNAIVLASGETTVGIGGGLPSRVDAVELAARKAGERARGAVLASDAFFPFPDGVEAAAGAGVTAVVQPGGSMRDESVVAAANRLGLAMVFTGTRHFRH